MQSYPNEKNNKCPVHIFFVIIPAVSLQINAHKQLIILISAYKNRSICLALCMWHGDWLFRDPLVPKMKHFKHKMMLKWVPECLSPAFLKSAKQIQIEFTKTNIEWTRNNKY